MLEMANAVFGRRMEIKVESSDGKENTERIFLFSPSFKKLT